MERQLFKCIILFWIGLFIVPYNLIAGDKSESDVKLENDVTLLDPIADVSMRFYAQWQISQADKFALHQRYGAGRVNFDSQGEPIPKGIAPQCLKRWHRLYRLCMSDGCYYCDASEGSCETGTCGPNNSHCKPYMDAQGFPKCGPTCADYAFAATLY